jgi:hypothetical protein
MVVFDHLFPPLGFFTMSFPKPPNSKLSLVHSKYTLTLTHSLPSLDSLSRLVEPTADLRSWRKQVFIIAMLLRNTFSISHIQHLAQRSDGMEWLVAAEEEATTHGVAYSCSKNHSRYVAIVRSLVREHTYNKRNKHHKHHGRQSRKDARTHACGPAQTTTSMPYLGQSTPRSQSMMMVVVVVVVV